MILTLEVLRGASQGQKFPLAAPTVTIGRAATNQVVLTGYHLSSEHGQIFREDDQFIYRDLRSTNGSRIRRGNDELVLDGAERAEAALQDGDQLFLGDPTQPVVLVCRVSS